MKPFITIILLLFCTTVLVGQKTFNEAIQFGDRALERGNFDEAINYYFAAEAFAPNNRDMVKKRIKKVFDAINQVKIQAENDKRKAIDAQARAEKATQEAVTAKNLAEFQKRQADTTARVGELITSIVDIQDNDPTLAIKLADYAYQYSGFKSKSAANFRYKLYDDKKIGLSTTSFRGHKGPILSVIFLPNKNQILTGSYDKTVKLWDLKGNELSTFTIGHSGRITSIAFSPSGDRILTGGRDKTVKLWDLKGNELATFSGHSGDISSVTFSPNGDKILTSSRDKTVKLWDLNGNELVTFHGHSEGVTSATFSPSGDTVLTGSYDKTAKLWDLKGNELNTFNGYDQGITSVTFSPSGARILTGGLNGTVKLWDLNGHVLVTFSGDAGFVSSMIFSPSGDRILTGDRNGTAKLWDLDGNELTTFIEYRGSAAFSPSGNEILTGGNKTAKLWDLKDNELAILKSGSGVWINSVAFSPNDKHVLTGGHGNKATLWDLDGNELTTFIGHIGAILSVAFSPNGNQVLTGSNSSDKTAKLWDLKGNELMTFSGHSDIIWSVAFSPSGDRILTGSGDKTAKLWDLEGNELMTFSGHRNSIKSVAFLPSGNRILTGGDDNTVKLWDLNGNELSSMTLKEQVKKLVFSPNGDRILTTDGGNTAKLWDIKGNELSSFHGDERDQLKALAFSPNGNQILTGGIGTMKLWDLKGNKLASFDDYQLLSLAFSKNGDKIAIGTEGPISRLRTNSNSIFFKKADHFSYKESRQYGLPFDYKTIDNSGLIWECGEDYRYKGNREDSLELALMYLDTARQIFEFLIDSVGGVYKDDLALVYEDYGFLYFEKEQYSNAIEAYRKAIALDSLFNYRNIYLATAYVYNGNLDKAITIFNQWKGKTGNKNIYGGYGGSRANFRGIDQNKREEPNTWTTVFLYYLEGLEKLDKRYINIQPKDTAILNQAKRYLKNQEIPSLSLAANDVTQGKIERKDAYQQLGEFYLQEEQFVNAIEVYQNVIALDPTYQYFNIHLATAYVFNGNLDKANSIFDQWKTSTWEYNNIFRFRPKTWTTVFLRYLDETINKNIEPKDTIVLSEAKLYLKNLEIPSLELIINDATQDKNTRREAYEKLGSIYFEKEQFSKAIETYRKVITLAEAEYSYSWYYMSLASAHIYDGDLAGAITIFQQQEKARKEQHERQKIIDSDGRSWAMDFLEYLEERIDKSIQPKEEEVIEQAKINLKKQHEEYLIEIADDSTQQNAEIRQDAYRYLGTFYFKEEQFSDAVKTYEKLTALNNAYLYFNLHLAIAHVYDGNLDSATALFDRFRYKEVVPFYYIGFSNRPKIWTWTAAFLSYLKSDEHKDIQPKDLDVVAKAKTYLREQRKEDLSLIVKDFKQDTVTRRDAYRDLASLYFKDQQFSKAIDAYQNIMALDNAALHFNLHLATVYLYNGDLDKATTIFNQWKGKTWKKSRVFWKPMPKTWTEAFLYYLDDKVDKNIPPKDPKVLEDAKTLLKSWIAEE